MTKSSPPPKVRPSGERRMANDSMTSLNLATALARADSLTSENLNMALRANRQSMSAAEQPAKSAMPVVRASQQANPQGPAEPKGEK